MCPLGRLIYEVRKNREKVKRVFSCFAKKLRMGKSDGKLLEML
jgi:hypothetical protein